MKKADDRTKVLVILILAAVAGLVYLLSMFLAYPVFQNTWITEPLAEIHSLFPLYYIAILLIALLGLSCFIFRIENKYLHILLLSMFAIMLWFTPYYLAGFARLWDTPAWVGVSLHAPEVLAGEQVFYSDYAQNYPGSFIYNYGFLTITGIEPGNYMTLFPLLFTLMFTLLWYAFISELFTKRAAFLSMLIAIPGLHYIILRPCPETIGVLLMITVLLLLARRGAAPKVIAMIAMVAMIISHPISPLLLMIFLGAGFLAGSSIVVRSSKRTSMRQVTLAGMLVVFFTCWFLSPMFSFVPGQVAGQGMGLTQLAQIAQVVPWGSAGELEVTRHYLFGTAFIYGSIYNVMRGIYFLYGVIVVILLLYKLVDTYLQQRSIRKWASELGGLSRSQIFVALSLSVVFLLTVLLTERGHGVGGLTERGLTFLVLLASCLIASVLAELLNFKKGKALSNSIVLVLVVLVIFLTLSFPVVAYKSEASLSIPVSEEVGIRFLAENVALDDRTLAMAGVGQLVFFPEAAFIRPEFASIGLPWPSTAGDIETDIAVFRRSDYYYTAMARDLSFEDNAVTGYLAILADSSSHNKIYSNPAFDVFLKR